MGKSTRKRQEEETARQQTINERLSAGASESGKTVRGAINAKDIMTPVMSDIAHRSVRPARDWRYAGKSKKVEKQQLELLRHMFGLYPAPRFLEAVMIDDGQDRDYIRWYIAAAQGESLYKTCAHSIMSKRETHLFLQAPGELTVRQAVWWAKAMALCSDIGVAYRIACCSISRHGAPDSSFWVDVHRFFTNNPVSLKEMDELLDYVRSEHAEDNNWSIKKRSLISVRRKSEEWHRHLIRVRSIGSGSWEGIDIPNWSKTTGNFNLEPKKNTEVTWHITQILTGHDLAAEGRAMRHCVSSYKTYCMTGRTAIFSMTSDTMSYTGRRNITIEVSRKRIVQARGLANRMPRPRENSIMRSWAAANGM